MNQSVNNNPRPPRSKILVLGATGGTGRLVVSQALARGHEVTVLVRSPEKCFEEITREKIAPNRS